MPTVRPVSHAAGRLTPGPVQERAGDREGGHPAHQDDQPGERLARHDLPPWGPRLEQVGEAGSVPREHVQRGEGDDQHPDRRPRHDRAVSPGCRARPARPGRCRSPSTGAPWRSGRRSSAVAGWQSAVTTARRDGTKGRGDQAQPRASSRLAGFARPRRRPSHRHDRGSRRPRAPPMDERWSQRRPPVGARAPAQSAVACRQLRSTVAAPGGSQDSTVAEAARVAARHRGHDAVEALRHDVDADGDARRTQGRRRPCRDAC